MKRERDVVDGDEIRNQMKPMPLITHLRQVPVLEQTHWKTFSRMEKHDTQHHTEDLNEWSSLAVGKNRFFTQSQATDECNSSRMYCYHKNTISHNRFDSCISELQIQEITKVIMKAFRS